MNCFEARNLFVAFWQKSLSDECLAQLTSHLGGCHACDRSFRAFALTAPVLYSARVPDWSWEQVRPASLATNKSSPSQVHSPEEDYGTSWTLNRFLPAFLLAAAAALVIYLAAPSPMTFEDAIAADSVDPNGASYSSVDSFLGQELVAQNATARDATVQNLADE
jgi:hypothetical protein